MRPGESNDAGVFVRDFARACENDLPGCSVFTHRKGTPGDYRDGVAVIEYRWLGKDASLTSIDLGSIRGVLKSASLLISGSLAYLRHCRRSGVSHSLSMWALPSGIYSFLAKKMYGTPYSVWVLGSDFWRYEQHTLVAPVLRRILQDADHCFADGMKFAQQVSAFCGRSCTFLPSTRNLEDIAAPPIGQQALQPRFLYVGRYEYNKGPDILLQAARLYLAEGGSGSFHFFGQGSLRMQMEADVAEARLGDRISIGGVLDVESLVARLLWCDYLIIPSRIESVPVILSDALQLGTPLIAAAVGDIPAILAGYDNGLTVAPENSDSLAKCLLEAGLREPVVRNRPHGLPAPLTRPGETAKRFLTLVGLEPGIESRSQCRTRIEAPELD